MNTQEAKLLEECFSSSYQEARNKFLAEVNGIKKYTTQLTFLDLDSKGCEGEELSIDIVVIGNPGGASKLFFHSSGIHGVEGFAGSAAQINIIKNIKNETILINPDEVFIFAHILNPYGMSWGRRWNENNIDLNRNCILSEEEWGKAQGKVDELYKAENYFINPSEPITWGDFFYLKAASMIVRHGFQRVKSALACGQYFFEKGLFYGGKQLEDGPLKLFEFLKDFVNKFHGIKKSVHIDFHTGLGPYAVDSLLVSDVKFKEKLEKVITEPQRIEVHGLNSSVSYDSITGCLTDAIVQILPNCLSLVQEFGTFDGVTVFKILREENADTHAGIEDLSVNHPSRQKVINAFYLKDDVKWQQVIISKGRLVFEQTLIELRQ